MWLGRWTEGVGCLWFAVGDVMFKLDLLSWFLMGIINMSGVAFTVGRWERRGIGVWQGWVNQYISHWWILCPIISNSVHVPSS